MSPASTTTKLAAPPKSTSARVVRVLLIGVSLAIFLLILAVRSVSLGAVWNEIVRASLPILSLTLFTRCTNLLIGAARTHLLIRDQHPFRFRVLFDSHLAGFAGNNLLPLRFGDLVRIDYMAQRGRLSHTACLQVVAVERLLDVLSLLTLCLVLAPFISVTLYANTPFYFATAASLAGALTIVAARLRPRWFIAIFIRVVRLSGERVASLVVPRIDRFVNDLATVAARSNTIPAFLLSLAIWGVSMFAVASWLWAFEVSMPWYTPFVVLLFLAFGMALPTTPGQIGTYHYFVAAGLTACGLDRVHSLSIALVAHVLVVIPFTVIGLPSLILFITRRSTSEVEPAAPPPLSSAVLADSPARGIPSGTDTDPG